MRARRWFVPLILAVVIGISLTAYASVFVIRDMNGSLSVYGPSSAQGSASVGFYDAYTFPVGYAGLPLLGTNWNATTYGNASVLVTLENPCYENATTGLTLYRTASVNMNITTDQWFIKDFLALGYPKEQAYNWTVYVTIEVKQPSVNASEASISVYLVNGTGSYYVGSLNLTQAGSEVTVQMLPGDALDFNANLLYSVTGSDSFELTFYVSQSPESP